MKILTIVGARPQFIKASAFSRAVKNYADVEEVIVHTGQHFDKNMSDIFFEEMEIPTPKYNLEIHSLSHGAMTGRMLEEIEKVLLLEKPDVLLVYGDTNSTLAGALAASKLHIPIAHVEAGLRSYNRAMPEEINRVLVDHVSTLLLCPSERARKNLSQEGITAGVHVAGDVMYDSVLFHLRRGDVVLVTSQNASTPRPLVGAYNASKSGLEAYAHTLQMELEGTGVRASIVRPGPTFTEMGWSWDGDLISRCLTDWQAWGLMRHHHYLPAEAIAAAVVQVVSAPRGTHVSLVEVNPEAPIRELEPAEPEPAPAESAAAEESS